MKVFELIEFLSKVPVDEDVVCVWDATIWPFSIYRAADGTVILDASSGHEDREHFEKDDGIKAMLLRDLERMRLEHRSWHDEERDSRCPYCRGTITDSPERNPEPALDTKTSP